MHVLTDENGNVLHCHHAHTHTHTIEHSHEHVHEEGHEGEHDHEHGGHSHKEDCGHSHSHGCDGGCNACSDAEAETLALVGYMVDHNKHHAMELEEMAKKLREMGKNDAAEQIEKAVCDFESGNVRLGVALSLLKTE